MSILRVGTTKKFSDNWDNIFGGGKGKSKGFCAATGHARQASKHAPKTNRNVLCRAIFGAFYTTETKEIAAAKRGATRINL